MITLVNLKTLLAAVGLLAYGSTASASTFIFSVPESTLETSFVTFLGANSNLYGAYDIFIRPVTTGDTNTSGGNLLSNYTLNSAGSPIPGNASDQWDTALQQTIPLVDSHLFIHFYFDPADTKLALVTGNANVAGKSYTNPTTNTGTVTGEDMPSGNIFKMVISSTDANIGGKVGFVAYTTSLQFTSSAATGVASKAVVSGPFEFSASGTQAPEHSTVGFVLGGIILITVGFRRRRKASR